MALTGQICREFSVSDHGIDMALGAAEKPCPFVRQRRDGLGITQAALGRPSRDSPEEAGPVGGEWVSHARTRMRC